MIWLEVKELKEELCQKFRFWELVFSDAGT